MLYRAPSRPRQLRLYFAHESGGQKICLGLLFLVKKTQKADSSAIALAEQRLSSWRSSQ